MDLRRVLEGILLISVDYFELNCMAGVCLEECCRFFITPAQASHHSAVPAARGIVTPRKPTTITFLGLSKVNAFWFKAIQN